MVNHVKQQIFILYLLRARHCYTLINQIFTPLFQIWPWVFTDFSITFESLITISKAQHHLTPASISASSHALLCFTQYNESHRPCPHWGPCLCFLSSSWIHSFPLSLTLISFIVLQISAYMLHP